MSRHVHQRELELAGIDLHQSAATAVASLTDDPIELLSMTSKPPVMARAASAELAHAIFRAMRSDHPERRIILREGDRIVADSRAE
jgi:hypothetical protein